MDPDNTNAMNHVDYIFIASHLLSHCNLHITMIGMLSKKTSTKIRSLMNVPRTL